MEPSYTPNAVEVSEENLAAVPWQERTGARMECFFSPIPRNYTYGSGNGVRTYSSVPMPSWCVDLMRFLQGHPNVCFLNRYDNERNALGWHSDNSPDTSDDHPISVVSFGEPREIWWRVIGSKGVVPEENRQLLEHGSLFMMPAGFQTRYEHRIPKGSRPMGTRISLTFRHMKS